MTQSNHPYECKYPIILSTKYNLTKLIVTSLREKYYHCGKNVILSKLVSEYCIVGGHNNLVRRLRECILCKRIQVVTSTQLIGHLPSPRTTFSKLFAHVGVDFTNV